ncbi:MAG: LemA family protein [Saprospiraceae bacterium]
MRPILIIALIVLGLIFAFSGCGSYNTFVEKDTKVEQAWANVQSAYQRRADLIPNLVATVKGAADFEQSTLTQVAEARAKATSIQVDPTNLTPEKMKEFQAAQGELSSALGRLLMVTENYPELRATQSFQELQAQLEGTENRIKVERDKFNNAVAGYNASVRKFPANVWAGLFGFDRKAAFEAQEGAQNAPKVEF